jgi:uncharacterized protein YceK
LRDVSDLIDVRSGAPYDLQRDKTGLNVTVEDESWPRKFGLEPPRYPVIDLPFSFVLDTVMLPATINAEIFH